jgi:hypothetical protein
MYASILNITFDCVDAKAQAEFWAAVTGWNLHEQDGAAGHIEYAVAAPSPGMPRLYFTTVPEPKQVRTGSTWTWYRPGISGQIWPG